MDEDFAPVLAVCCAGELAPVVDYIAPTLAVPDAALTPVVEHSALLVEFIVPVVEHIAPVLSVRAEHADVDVCIALAPAMAYTAQAPVVECNASDPAVSYAAPSRVIEHEAPISAHDYHASMLDIIETFHQPVGQIPDVPTLASSSSACAAPAPVDRLQLDREAQEPLADRAAAELLAEDAAGNCQKGKERQTHKIRRGRCARWMITVRLPRLLFLLGTLYVPTLYVATILRYPSFDSSVCNLTEDLMMIHWSRRVYVRCQEEISYFAFIFCLTT